MMSCQLEEVFGVRAKPVLSYVERADVDARFKEALDSGKQVVVYGSSKQGKTALIQKHLGSSDHISISLSPKTTVADVYRTLLGKAGVRIMSSGSEKRGASGFAKMEAKVKAILPMLASSDISTSVQVARSSDTTMNYEEIAINLELPQPVADLLHQVKFDKWVILENFHYLADSVQRDFSFDLRSFHELGIRFIILGVWREKNRMAQFNGDLLDRLVEVPVEPWLEGDFKRVVLAGEEHLNIRFDEGLIYLTIEASFSSIGVFQELLKGICYEASVRSRVSRLAVIDNPVLLSKAIQHKAREYGARHQQALESIAAGHSSGRTSKSKLEQLFLPYYLVRVILEAGFLGIRDGMWRSDIHENLCKIHHREGDVRPSDISNLLVGLAKLQSEKSIFPPIFDYDAQNRLLNVVDSTFYFFIKHANIKELVELLPDPRSPA